MPVDNSDMQSAIKTATRPQRANARTTMGPALAAVIPGSTKIPAQTIVPMPIDIAAPSPSSRASSVPISPSGVSFFRLLPIFQDSPR